MIKGTINLTKGSIIKNALTLSLPLLISYLLQVTISLVDLKMVSSLGKEAIAGVGIAQQFIMLAFLIFTAVSVGASIYLSQYTGKDDIAKVRETVIQTILLSVIIGVILTLLSLTFVWPLIKLMSAAQPVLEQAHIYTIISFYFAPIMLLNFTLISIFRATGDSKTPLYVMLFINILNVIFNYFLIYGIWIFPAMGVKGAALGTGLSRTLGVIVSLVLLYKRGLLIKVERLRDFFTTPFYVPRFAPMRKIFSLGFPSALQDVSWSIAMLTIAKILSMLPKSTEALSAFSIAFNVEAICFMPGIAFMQAATIMVGQHIGAGQIKEAEKAAWINTAFGSLFMAFLGIPLAIFPRYIISFFTKDISVIEIGSVYLTLMGFTQIFVGIKFILMGSLNGAGDTKVPFYAELIEHWAFRVPLIIVCVLYLGYGTTAVWVIMALSNAVNAIFVLFAFTNGYWKRIKLI